jgi:hydrogenase nickel incorporation protein HypA/HybF
VHEFSVIEQVLKTVEFAAKQNGLSKVTRIVLQIGKLRQVIPDFLQFAFSSASSGTIAEHAVLDIKQIPVEIECLDCCHVFEQRHAYLCVKCQSNHIKILKGKELLIETIEGDKNAD